MALLSVPLSAHSPAQRGSAKDVQHALDEGAALELSGDAAGALESYRWALEASAANSPERARALMALSQVKRALGRYADAARDTAAAGDVYEALGDSKGVASTLNRRGGIAQIAGDYVEAERLFTAALARSTSIGDREGRAQHLANLANSQFYVGRYADAARMFYGASQPPIIEIIFPMATRPSRGFWCRTCLAADWPRTSPLHRAAVAC